MQGSCLRGATGFSKALRIGCPGGADALPGTSNRFVKREPSFNADYRGNVTCLYDTQLLDACLHASECGGRPRPEAVRGMPEVPIAPPSHRAPGGVGGCRLCQPSLFQQGVVGAFAEGFGFLTSDFGVGKSQDLGC